MRTKRILTRIAQSVMAVGIVAGVFAIAHAQQDSEVDPNPSYDGRYAFARIRYAELPDEPCRCLVRDSKGASGWQHDYPHGDTHIMKILASLTTLRGHTDSSVVLRLHDPEIMKYPILYLTEPGCWHPSEKEVAGLRTYLLKGGFLIADDFTICTGGFENCEQSRLVFEQVMRRVLPNGQIRAIDQSDPLLNGFFKLDTVDLQNNLTLPFRVGPPAQIKGIYENNDPKRRLMVAANYNAVMHRFWDWQDQGIIPVESKNEAYKLGVNYLLYGFTH